MAKKAANPIKAAPATTMARAPELVIPAKTLKHKAVVLASKTSFKGHVFSVTTDTVIEPGGVKATRDVVRHSGSIVVLAVDASENPRDPKILIERQYRHAANSFLLELPAGRIDPGETPLAAARRELIEETGYRARKWTKLVRYFASPGFLAETMQVFLAEDLRPGEAKPEEDERITLQHVPLSELVIHIRKGEVLDGKTILSTLFYEKFLFHNTKV